MPVIESAGGTGRLNIRINRECTWSARSEVDWIAISPASGQGDAQIDYSVAANPLAAPRTGVIVVNEQRAELRQAAACLYTLTPRQQTAQSSGERLTVTVSTAAGCAWTAVSQSSWISVESGANGSGNGTVSLLVTPNTGASRTGTVSIAGQPHTVSQAAAEGTPAPPRRRRHLHRHRHRRRRRRRHLHRLPRPRLRRPLPRPCAPSRCRVRPSLSTRRAEQSQ